MELSEALKCLAHTGRHRNLIDRHKAAPDNRLLWYKIVFAYRFESKTLPILYKVLGTGENESNAVFEYESDGISILFELFRVGNIIKTNCSAPNESSGSVLVSNAGSEKQKATPQVIRLQNTIHKMPLKLNCPSGNTINIIAVDCSEIYCGLFDEEDVRVAMIGLSNNPLCQEYWGEPPFRDSDRMIGIFEDAYAFRSNGKPRRGVAQIQRNVDGVIFTPKPFEDNGTNREMVYLNPKFGWKRNQFVLKNITSLAPMVSLNLVK